MLIWILNPIFLLCRLLLCWNNGIFCGNDVSIFHDIPFTSVDLNEVLMMFCRESMFLFKSGQEYSSFPLLLDSVLYRGHYSIWSRVLYHGVIMNLFAFFYMKSCRRPNVWPKSFVEDSVFLRCLFFWILYLKKNRWNSWWIYVWVFD